jgi:hypothetical protein
MSGRQDIEEIRTRYRVEDGAMALWSPSFRGLEADFLGEMEITRTEGRMLDELMARRGLLGLNQFRSMVKNAYGEAATRFADNPPPEGIPADIHRHWQSNDGHRDAFRHTYWNALMTRQYGEDWAKAFATAHEGLPGNSANREAMDLYNNEVGRKIATDNPVASPEQLATLVEHAVHNGTVIVIDKNGDLAWSDQVAIGQHGLSKEEVLAPAINTPGMKPLPDWSDDPALKRPLIPAEPVRAPPKASSASESLSVAPSPPDQGTGDQRGPADPSHPDYTMLAQIREGVRKIDAGLGKPFDESSERLSHCLLPECKDAGLRHVDHVVMGKDGTHLFAVQGQLEDPAHLRAHVATEQGIRIPVEQSDERLLAVNQTIERQNAIDREQALARQSQDQARSGPALG